MTDLFDIDGDGIADGQMDAVDVDGDGVADTLFTSADSDGDGFADTFAVEVDIDGDGLADVGEVGLDLDGDGSVDVSFAAADTDGDGVADVFASPDEAASIWADVDGGGDMPVAEETFDGFYEDMSFPGYDTLYEAHGTPIEDMALWDPQDSEMSCAVATTNMMFRSVGINDVGETQIAEVFEKAGIYDPSGGTNPDLIDDQINIMAREMGLDMHAEEFSGFTPDSLAEMLDTGVRPLVGVDSSELYDPITRTLNEIGLVPDAGHAVQVTGIVQGEGGDFVVINDPGFPGGAGQQIPMDQFMDAAEDYGFQGVAVMAGAPAADSFVFPWVHMASLAAVGAVSAAATKRRR